jgi:hypothetical protein
MIFYHCTSENKWERIQKEGVLWGIASTYTNGKQTGMRRYTYLSPWPLTEYGDVILKVAYEPRREDFGKKHNYGFDPPPGMVCDQFCVFDPIPLLYVERIYEVS